MAEYCPYCMRQSSGKYCTYCGGEIAFQGKKSHLPVGTRLIGTEAPYLLGASIGQGGFGVTYAALNCASGERVAVKEYFPVYWSGRSKMERMSFRKACVPHCTKKVAANSLMRL